MANDIRSKLKSVTRIGTYRRLALFTLCKKYLILNEDRWDNTRSENIVANSLLEPNKCLQEAERMKQVFFLLHICDDTNTSHVCLTR